MLSASQRIPLFWREAHKKGLRARFHSRLEEDEERKVPEQNSEELATVRERRWSERGGC